MYINFLYILNSMEACLCLQVSCCLINDNHQAENERYWRNKKNQKYSKKS